MAKIDEVTKEYMQIKEVFADAFNYFLFEGKEIIVPSCLKNLGTELLQRSKGSPRSSHSLQSHRDPLCLLAMEDDMCTYLLLVIDL